MATEGTYFWTFGTILALLQIFILESVEASVTPITQNLTDHLFHNYKADLLPVCEVGTNVTVKLDIALRQVIELNEKEQILTANIWLRMTWNDCRLAWNQSDHNNIDHFLVSFKRVWVPDITLYDSADTEMRKEDYMAQVSSSGLVSFNFPTIIKSVCKVNVRYFPFDTQTCGVTFGSWAYSGLEIDFWYKHTTGDMDTYINNIEWEIVDLPVKRKVRYYNCCPEPYPDLTYCLVMRRIPSFYIMTMLFPCIVCTVIAAISFLLPVESGEKVSLGITVLLSLAVFLLVVSESLPPASDNFPIIGDYFATSMVLVSLSCVQSVIVINVFYRGSNGRRMPRWAKIVFLKYLATMLCMRRKQQMQSKQIHNNEGFRDSGIFEKETKKYIINGTPEGRLTTEDSLKETNLPGDIFKTHNGRRVLSGFVFPPVGSSPLEEQNAAILRNIEDRYMDKEREDDLNQDWRDLSSILDMTFLILYALITVVTTLALLLQCIMQA